MNINNGFLGLIAVALFGCNPATPAPTSSLAVSGSGYDADVIATNSWQGGFNGAVRVSNTSGSAAVASFEVTFTLNGSAGISGQAWNGSISSASPKVATNPAWLQYSPLTTGKSWDVGFSGTGSFSGATITSLKINGNSITLGSSGGGGGTPTDTTAPTVSISSSASSVTTASTITLTATASDNVGVASVDFLDGSTVIATDTSAPYSTSVALSSSNNGTKNYTAKAKDAAGNTATSSVVPVTVNIPQACATVAYSVSLASSVSSVTAPGSISLTSNVTPDSSTTKVEFFDGSTSIGTDTSSPYSTSVSFTSANNGTKTYTAKVSGTSATCNPTPATSAAITVTVNIQATTTPTASVSLSASPSSITSGSSSTLSATPTVSGTTVTSVEFLSNNSVIGTDTTSPYSISVSPTSTTSYTARVNTAANVSATSSASTVTVTTGGSGGGNTGAKVKIMALGDSITGSPGCWRALLWQHLQQTGYTNIDMVGTLGPQGCSVSYDGDNEGHGGAFADVTSNGPLATYLSATNPDVVLMNFGTNDIWSGSRTTQSIIDAYSRMLASMRSNNSKMILVISQPGLVSPSGCSTCPSRTAELNAAITTWAANNTTSASPIFVADLNVGWVVSTMTSDGVHPNDTGIVQYEKNVYPVLIQALPSRAKP